MYTSLEFSKQLKDNGCELESEMEWTFLDDGNWIIQGTSEGIFEKTYPAYDIIYDICIKYAIPFFGEKFIDESSTPCNANHYHAQEILYALQQSNPLNKIEEYIWENCLFISKNK